MFVKIVKCPRCETQIESDTENSDVLVCPKCAARLRFRRGADAAPEDNGGLPEGEFLIDGTEDFSAPPPAQSVPSAVPQDILLPPGTRLGGFEIQKAVGRGGMATVYRGIQLSLKRAVAIKVLASRFSQNSRFVERFDREAGALANLNHPNIVNIIDKGAQDNQYYFVMELVEGITLDQLIHSVELTERHYIHIISEISKALAYVHSKGIIHRDLKPANVLVNKHGLVKVSDFGIAHITEAAGGEKPAPQAAVGTANYMAPEQAERPMEVDERADIYALAVTFYKMFTKRLPIGDFTAASSLNTKLPRSVDLVLAKAMQPNPNDRFPAVKEFCDSLIQCFTVATSGAAKSDGRSAETGSEVFLFNPELFKSSTSGQRAGVDPDSSSSSLFVPRSYSLISDSVATKTPSSAGIARAEELKKAPEPPPEPEEQKKAIKTRLIQAGVVLAILAMLGIAAFYGYLLYRAYYY